jgi:P27 family predicted phage terminase small subunit
MTRRPSAAPPADLTPDTAKTRWRLVYPRLAKRGDVDREVLANYCQVWARWRKAEDGLASAGSLTKTPAGRIVASPLVDIAKSTAVQVRALEDQLGLRAAAPTPPAADTPEPAAAVATSPGRASKWAVVTREQLATLMGVHPDTVTDNVRRGMPVLLRGGHGKEGAYDAVACLDWQRSKIGKNAKDNAQTRLFDLTAQLKELELDLQKRNLIPRDQIVKEGQAFVKAWTALVRALPRRLVQAGAVAVEHEAIADAVVRELLVEISGWQTSADAVKATKVA